MRTIKTLNIRTDCRSPVSDNRGRAPLTAWLVRKLPRKDSRATLIPAHDGGNKLLVLCLAVGVGVPLVFGDAVVVGVDSHASEVAPEVDEGDNELNVVFLGRGDDGVKFLEPRRASVDYWCLPGHESLEIGSGR